MFLLLAQTGEYRNNPDERDFDWDDETASDDQVSQSVLPSFFFLPSFFSQFNPSLTRFLDLF